MPDNTFENKLNQQMGDFGFTPSEAVWQKLETDLRKRNKRRWAIIWFISGLVVLSAGLYFYSQLTIPDAFNSITQNSGESINTENKTAGGNNSTPPLKGNNNDEVYARTGQSITGETVTSVKPETLKATELKIQTATTVSQQQKIDKQGKPLKGKIEIDQSDEYNVAKPEKTGEKTKLTADTKDTDSENIKRESAPREVFGNDSTHQAITIHNDDPAVSSPLTGGLQNVNDSAISTSNELKTETKNEL